MSRWIKCEIGGCTKKAKVQVSSSLAWTKNFCFRHALGVFRQQLRFIAGGSSAMFVQRSPHPALMKKYEPLPSGTYGGGRVLRSPADE